MRGAQRSWLFNCIKNRLFQLFYDIYLELDRTCAKKNNLYTLPKDSEVHSENKSKIISTSLQSGCGAYKSGSYPSFLRSAGRRFPSPDESSSPVLGFQETDSAEKNGWKVSQSIIILICYSTVTFYYKKRGNLPDFFFFFQFKLFDE